MLIIKYRKIFYAISLVLIGISLFGIFKFGLNLGVDFKGGSLVEVKFSEEVSIEKIENDLSGIGFTNVVIRETDDNGFIIRTDEIKEEERGKVVAVFSGGEIKRFDTVGPVLGAELRKKAGWSIFWVLFAIILFITFAFRHVSKPVASWKYGVIAIIALLHDVIVPTGVFAFLGEFRGVEIDSLFITALLVVLGFSIHDTIVVFDRTRENLRINEEKRLGKNFETIVGDSVSQTFIRSINTSLTTLISLVVLYFVGPEATKNFVLALLIGVTVGTYSSIFIGSPLLVTWEKISKK